MESIFPMLRSTHYFLMIILLVFLLFTIGKFTFKKMGKEPFGVMEDKTTLIVLILSHIQLLLGLTLLFVGPMSQNFADMGAAMKNAHIRMMLIEHPLTMIIGVIMITIGRIRWKSRKTDSDKFKTVIIFFSIALVLFLARIPWGHFHG